MSAASETVRTKFGAGALHFLAEPVTQFGACCLANALGYWG